MDLLKSFEKLFSFKKMNNITDIKDFLKQVSIDDNTDNGLYFNGIYIPQEIVCLILSNIDSKDILKYSMVCKKWHNIIKSFTLWSTKYKREYGKKAKKLPWYLYHCLFATNFFDTNLLKNGCGENEYEHWEILKNYGDEFRIEDPPCGADPLPPNVCDFNGKTSCFATSYYECRKQQYIPLNKRIYSLILDTYKPTIYVSEWVCGRFDCACKYSLKCALLDNGGEILREQNITYAVEQWAGKSWEKVEIIFKEYEDGVKCLVFQHEGQDCQFWKGHYGSKMAGGVVKILFDSITPIED